MKNFWSMDESSRKATIDEYVAAARKGGIRDAVMTEDHGVQITFTNGVRIWDFGRTISFRYGTQDVIVTL